jgi:serine phosphatase RsbU (regulator of sigma subunit)
MEGLSDNWIETGNRHIVPFSKIPPGDYILHIKGSNNDKVWNDVGISIKIIVSPPWWRSNWAYAIYIIIIISLIFLFIKAREYNLIRTKKILEQKVEERTNEINHQKEEILAQHEEIQNQRDIATSQRDYIARQNKAITDSIHYAQRIQKALLPAKESISHLFSDYLILFKPKDIVSGDFYSIKQVKDHIIVAVADCTGHGIPGAFMSMLGMSIFNEILRYEEITSASEVLEELRKKLKISLQQTGKAGEQQDGMDIAICAIDIKTLEMQFAGANNSLWLFKNGSNGLDKESELIEIQADKQPVGVYRNEKPYTNNHVQLKKGDIFYIFSDGFRSQFGGERGETFKTRRFRELIGSIHQKPLLEQEKILENEFLNWKGKYEQIDDVLILGLKV